MTQFVKRIIFSLIIIPVTVSIVFFAPFWVFFLMVEFFVLTGMYEYLLMIQKKGVVIHRSFSLIIGAAIPFAMQMNSIPLLLMVTIMGMMVVHFHPALRKQAIWSIGLTIFGLLYVCWFCAHLILIRELPHGAAWVFYTILLVKGGDMAAYFIGQRFGRHKLIEHVSPNKSVEGSIANLAGAVLLSLLSALYLPPVGWLHLVLLGILVGIFSQLGDLGESILKRDAGVKDSGAIPGLGGILDILDSLIPSIPLVYFYLTLFVI